MPNRVLMTTNTREGNRRRVGNRQGERGATMVEFAIVAVALFTLIFGIIEGAFAVRARNTINNATDDAARRGAVAGTSPNADFLILRQLVGRGADSAATIEYVVVYKAENGSSEISAGCKAGSAAQNECNVYGPSDLDAAQGDFFCNGGLGSDWCPENRGTGGELGFLGVYVKAKYEPIVEQLFVEMDFEVNANSLQAIETSGEL